MLVNILDDKCWVQAAGCTINKNLTTHHALPKHLKPKRNITVSVCKNCHGKINANDITGMYAYAHKLERLAEELRTGVRILKKIYLHIYKI